jgi:hypothetical protein
VIAVTAAVVEVLRTIADGRESGCAQPLHIGLHTPDTGYKTFSLEIRLADNAADGLPAWVAWFALDPIQRGNVLSTSGRCWRSHQAHGMWCGWSVEVWTSVDEPQDGAP